jgi:hypothetical protein
MSYASVNDKRIQLRMHNLILGITPKGTETDHKDRNGLNNRKDNLRVTHRSVNRQNSVRTKSISGFKGVSRCSGSKKWRARISFYKQQTPIGYFSSRREAAEAYDKKALELYGPDALTNKKLGLL